MLNLSTSLRLAAFSLVTTVAMAEEPPPLFGDWYYMMPENWLDPAFTNTHDRCNAVWESVVYDDEVSYVPVNQPGGGHGGPSYEGGNWRSDYAVCVSRTLDLMDAPVAILLRNRNCPFPYGRGEQYYDPSVLENALNNLPKLDYLLMDLELEYSEGGEMLRRNVEEIHRLVRTHPNPRIRNARIGNYNDWPGESDPAMIWPSKRDRKSLTQSGANGWDRDAFYSQYFDVAMPIAYPSEAFSRHSDEVIQGESKTPNDHAAVFWGPLERVSMAARSLPDGHMLIPWITNYLQHTGGTQYYHAPPPTEEDLRMLVQHYRLRGARSFMIWTGDNLNTHHPWIDYETFRELALDAWRELDPIFENGTAVEFLNLKTNKTSGLQWSGIRTGSTVYITVSNLHHELAQSATLPAMDGLPAETPLVGPGEHETFVYTLDTAARDFDSDGDIDTADFIAFITAMRTGQNQTTQTVGGKGVGPLDIDTSGIIDLGDLIAVGSALRDGKFSRPAPDQRRTKRRSFASAPTRGQTFDGK